MDIHQKKLLEEKICKDKELKYIEEQIGDEIEDASEQAMRDPFPSSGILTENVYV